MRKFFFRPRTIPLAFFLLCLIAYGLLIPWLGFYWDDWPYTWFARTLGPMGLLKALAEDRPFLAVSYMTTTTLMGQNPLTWQIFAIVTRWLSVMALWWSLRQVWPSKLRLVTWTTLLFAVYPGFLQHWISVIYSQAYLLMAAFIFSLGLMVYAARRWYGTRRYWLITALSLFLSAFTFFSTEYFFGVELIRPVLLWMVISETIQPVRKRILPVLVRWAPYLVEFAVFAIWRAFFFQASTYDVAALEELSNSVTGTLWGLIQTLFANSFTAGWSAWNQAFNAPNIWDFTIRTSQLYWLVVLATLAAALLYLFRLKLEPADETVPASGTDLRWAVQAIVTGLLILFASSLPFWAAGLPLNLLFPFNRFTLAMMIGSCLLLVGLLEFLIRTMRQKVVILSLLLCFAVGLQFLTANTFRREWDSMRSLYWQMAWRMPGLQPGTMVLTHQFPFQYYTDNSLSAPLNLVYAPDFHGQDMPYILNYTRVRLKNTLPGLEKDQPFKQHYRAMTFQGNTSDTVVLYYAPPACLRVLDPVYVNGETLPDLPAQLKEALPLTNFERIIASPNIPAAPPAALFGQENSGSWCYYFEKAELARQTGDWQQVAELGSQAQENGKGPADPTEWLTIVEGYARTSQWTKARALSDTILVNKPDALPGACQTWQRLAQIPGLDSEAQTAIQNTLMEYQCSQTIAPTK